MEGRRSVSRGKPESRFKLWKQQISGLLAVIIVMSMVLNVPLLYSTEKFVFAAENFQKQRNGSLWATASNVKYCRGDDKDVGIYIVMDDNEVMPGNETEMTIYLKNNTEEEITDGVLKFKSRYIKKENAAFTLIEENVSAIQPEDELEAAEQEEFEQEFGIGDEEERDNGTLKEICLLPGQIYPVQFTFYTDEEAKMAKAFVEFTFRGETEERKISSSEKWYYGIGMPYVNLELTGGAMLETGIQNEMNIWMEEPGWYLDDWDDGKQEEREDIYREQIGTSQNPASSSQAKASASQAKHKGSASNAELNEPEADGWKGQIASPSDAEIQEKLDQYVNQAMYIDASRVSYEVTIYGISFRRFRASCLEQGEDIGWINCLYQVAENAKPGRYYGKVTAAGKWHRRSFISTQGFWFEVTGEGKLKLSGTLDQGKITAEGPVSSFPEAEKLELQVSDLGAEEKRQVEEALRKQMEEEGISTIDYRAVELVMLADGEEAEPAGPVSVRFEHLEFTDQLTHQDGNQGKMAISEAEGRGAASDRSEDADSGWTDDADFVQTEGAEPGKVRVYHLDQAQVQVNEMQISQDGANEVTMETDHFSTFILVRVSGKTKGSETIYEQLKKEIQALEDRIQIPGEPEDEERAAAEELLQRLDEAYNREELTEEQYKELQLWLHTLLYGDVNCIAEPSEGTNRIELANSGWFEEFSEYTDIEEFDQPEDTDFCLMSRSGMKAAAYKTGNGIGEKTAGPSDQQVVDRGGSNTGAEGVTVSKTIAGTELENVFDITLQVQTQTKISEIYKDPDMAVVIVMDISNTMNKNFGNTTRYQAAMNAAEAFLDKFAANNSGSSRIGYVAFNTDAHKIFDLQACSSQTKANSLKNTMRKNTGAIINASDYDKTHNRFTNIEAGLKMASDMLNGASNRNQYIIFLSDGFPTTYVKSGYTGYDPYDSSGKIFYDAVLKKRCLYGTSYSDKAAIRARKQAVDIKAIGTEIFSIGVDVGGQTIQMYIEQSEKAQGYSVVDRTGTSYEIGNASSTQAYKDWLKNKIGSGHYFDSTDSSGLNAAYEEIFRTIKEQIEAGSKADWVSKDPIPTVSGSADTVEFIGFYNKSPQLVFTDLTGINMPGGENTAVFRQDEASINWDLKNSGYQSMVSGNVTTYIYQLVYRVRLKNEAEGFAEAASYPTNDTTTLQYRYVETIDGSEVISDSKMVEFPIPSVKGYLSELSFQKTDSLGRAVKGAEFTLSHDAAGCPVCRGDGKTSVAVPDMVQSSKENGEVAFERIPSGHQYILTETKVPAGYQANRNHYGVAVAYDKIAVSVTDSGGNSVQWDHTIVNAANVELPETGGWGTAPYTFGGIAVMALALMYEFVWRKKRVL